jgi:hypothetical protein
VANEWEPKQNCSASLVRSWKAQQKMNGSNIQLPTPIQVVHNQALTGTIIPITVNEVADSQLELADHLLVYHQQNTHP